MLVVLDLVLYEIDSLVAGGCYSASGAAPSLVVPMFEHSRVDLYRKRVEEN